MLIARCFACKSTFLQQEGRCPFCGSMAITIPFDKPKEAIKENQIWYTIAINKKTGKVEYAFPEKES